ncbi:MAG: Rieske (2Fe-2S) protein [Candidatus Marinimicrobia bacterium]|nr:Rieske (2Fe-2S) protein [Candidatus Neomarinimicrobiota bacterium]
MENEQPEQASRRDFLLRFGAFGALVLALGGFTRHLLVYFTPKRKLASTHKYLVSKVDEIPVGKAKEIKIQGKPVFVVHLEDGFKVFSGVCTHLGCIVRWEPSKSRFYCPCHKGIFDETGQVTGGPPPRALDEFKVELDKNLVFIEVADKQKGPWT